DRGVRLSGGQKQRICIARELYRQPSMLILDEATNALDADTEQIIRDTLLRLRGKTTIVLITHRAYHALDADRVIILDQGRVIEMGPPHTLKNRPDSHYYRAQRRQMEMPLGIDQDYEDRSISG
ncbi:MAG: ATP-binding cassette domain-containing protein, partial [Cyclobacteriaceae bacterium]|nr:ATP-binding cassette domain-containing protein [Cyclobacteriaceae bacterium]